MKNITRFYLILLILLSFSSFSVSQTASIPDIAGKWIGSYRAQSMTEIKEWISVMNVTEQNGEFFKGEFLWAEGNTIPQAGFDSKDKISIIGVFDFDNRTFYICSDDEIGFFRGEVISGSEIQTVYYASKDSQGTLVYRLRMKKME